MSTRRKRKTAASVPNQLQPQQHQSKYHPGLNCSDCVLCGHAITTVAHFGAWGTAEKLFVTKHSGKELPPSSCICKAHYIEAKRHCSHEEYIPKWKRIGQRVESELVCNYPKCSVTANDGRLIEPSFQSPAVIKLALNIGSTVDHLVLCSKHYAEAQRKLAPSCASCGMKPKRGTQFTRHCPDPETIN